LLTTLQKVLRLFTPEERRQLGLVFALILAMSLLEVVGVASIMPFLDVLANPGAIQESTLLSGAYDAGGFQDTNSFLFAMGVSVFVVIIVTNGVGFASVWVIQRFTWMRNHSVSTRLLDSYVFQPWTFYLQRNTSELSANILSETQSFIAKFLLPLMMAVSNGITAVAVGLLLLLMDPLLALMVTVVIGGAYGLIFVVSRKRLLRYGKLRRAANKERYRFASEAMSAMKTVKVLGVEHEVVDLYAEKSFVFSRTQSSAAIIGFAPRYFLETMAFGAVIVILLYQLLLRGDVSQVIPVVGVYAFAGYRLLPKIQLVFSSVSQMQYTGYTLDVIYDDTVNRSAAKEHTDGTRIEVNSCFGLENVSFRYPNAATPALDGVTVNVKRRTSIGLVGTSGSGKTTCMDVMLGLLEPKSGSIVVDGKRLDASERYAWRRNLGYVPQAIYLSDDTIAANIAFGIPKADIDMAAVERAARIANLHGFIESELPEGYATFVGERGVRLSGGQRQRIGIARALYRDPVVLLFDEATSALDSPTEQAIMEAIESLAGEKTIIMIAHRLTTVQNCDRIYRLEHGKVAASGSWDELVADDPVFSNMASTPRQDA